MDNKFRMYKVLYEFLIIKINSFLSQFFLKKTYEGTKQNIIELVDCIRRELRNILPLPHLDSCIKWTLTSFETSKSLQFPFFK